MVRHLAAGLVASLALPVLSHLQARAAAIPLFLDSAELARDIQAQQKKAGPHSVLRVLAAALSYAPRVGEAFAADILADLDRVIRKAPLDQDLFQAVELLE